MVLTIMYRTIQSILSRNWPLLLCLTPFSIVRFKWLQKMLPRPRLWLTVSTQPLKAVQTLPKLPRSTVRQGRATWISSANYEGAQVDGDNLKYIAAITTLGQNELANLALGQANVILQVMNKKSCER